MTRIPRPKSTTILAIKYRQSNNPKDRYNLIGSIITHYTNNGFHYLTKSVSLPELSMLTKISENDLMDGVIEQSNTFTRLLSPNSAEEVTKHLRQIFATALTWLHGDRYRFEDLANRLGSQLTYPSGKPNLNAIHPYIKALELGNKQVTNLQGLIALLMPKGPQTQIAIFNTASSEAKDLPEDKRPMTRQEALELIEPQALALQGSEAHLAQLQVEHGIEATPEVRAIRGDEKGPILAQNNVEEALNQELILDIDFDLVQSKM